MAHDLMDHAAPTAHALPPTQTFRLTSGDTERVVGLGQVTEDLRRHARGLHDVDLEQLAATIMRGLFDGLNVEEYRKLCVHAAATLTFQEPQHSKLAARLLHEHIELEAASQRVHSFAEAIATGHEVGLVNARVATLVRSRAAEYEALIQPERSDLFEFFGLRTLYDRYLLRHPHTRKVIEHPQHFFLRVAAGLSDSPADAAQLYNLMSSLSYLASSPTLFNSGTNHEQLSSCFLLDSPQDDLGSIYDCYRDIAMLSKFSGGIGLPYHRVRSRGALIRSTNGASQGIVPWLKTLDSSVAAVNQCFDPATLLYTADGPRAIRDVRVGDLVLGISGAYRQVTEKFVYTQHEPMVELDIKHAIEPVRVTDGHPFYVIQGAPMEQSTSRTIGQLERGKLQAQWIGAGQLQRGDYIAQVIPTEIVPVEGFSEDDARMYGILLGDGHMTSDGREWGVSGNPQRDAHLSFVQEYLSARGIHCWFNDREESYLQIRWAAGQGALRDATTGRITGAGAPTMPFAREDLYDAEGRKHIARRFAHLPHPQTIALLQGLIETDGCISRGKEITFTNTSMPLVEGLRYQLLRLGVPTSGQYREREQDHVGRRTDGTEIRFQGTTCAYDVRIPALPALAERLGCAPLTKHNWVTWQGCVFTRVRGIAPCAHTPFVCDLKVEGDVSYMTTSGLAHNGGRRKGACCVYLETWHPDIEEFLELRDNTGEESRRTYNLNLSNWIPDLFMRRVEADGMWSLFDPAAHPTLCDLWGEAFEQAYEAAERAGTYARQVKARDLYARMVKTLAETGNGWMTFKDACNSKCNQTAKPGTIVHSSNLCTEIVEVTTNEETAVCLAEGTLILTQEGLKPIESCDGARVYVPYASDESFARQDRFVTAQLIDNGVRETVIVRGADGREIHATPDHRFLVRINRHRTDGPDQFEWKTAGALQPGDLLATPSTHSLTNTSAEMDKEWQSVGWLVGDGWQRNEVYGVCFGPDEDKARAQVLRSLRQWSDQAPAAAGTPHVNFPRVRRDHNGVWCWATERRALIELLQERFGLHPHLAAQKELPAALPLTDLRAVSSFLNGLFSADGTVDARGKTPSVSLTSASFTLLRQVQRALTMFGIHGRIRRAHHKDGRSWGLLSIHGGSNLTQFAQHIGFGLCPEKEARLQDIAPSANDYKYVRQTLEVDEVVPGTPQRVYDLSVEDGHHFIAEGTVTHNCNLGSLNLSKFIGLDGKIREEALADAVRVAITFLDRVIDQNFYPTKQASASNNRWRPVGLGMMGLQDVFFKLRIPFDSPEALELSNRLQEFVYFHALKTSCALAQQKGKHDAFDETRAAQGVLQFDLWGVTPTMEGWDALKADVQRHGLRNSLLLAIAPTATIASIAGCYECIEPQVSNLFKRETLSGEFIQINRFLVRDLKQMGLWTPEIRDLIKQHNGSVQHIEELPAELRDLYRTAWELSQKALIDLAAGRSPYIDQSQSLNLFMAAPTIGKLSSMYVYAWKQGLKTTYYLRSRPATEIRKTTTSPSGTAAVPTSSASSYNRDPDAIACSLENPESCEACN